MIRERVGPIYGGNPNNQCCHGREIGTGPAPLRRPAFTGETALSRFLRVLGVGYKAKTGSKGQKNLGNIFGM
jgi:hypothetical protein